MTAMLAVTLWAGLATQSPEDLGVGAPLSGPSAADLGVDPSIGPSVDARGLALPDASDEDAASEGTANESGRWRSPAGTHPAEKAARLRADVDAALVDLEPDPRVLQDRLDRVAATWASESIYALDPSLKAAHRLVKARALALAGRVEEAELATREASRALDAVVHVLDAQTIRRVRAAVRFWDAFAVEVRARASLKKVGCGAALGLKRLVQDEVRARRRLLDNVVATYAPVAKGDDRFWARRAAFFVAVFTEDFLRTTDQPGSLRAATLPSPFALDDVELDALVLPAYGAWNGELRRAFLEVAAAVDAREPDPELLARAKERALRLVRDPPLPSSLSASSSSSAAPRLKNPWTKDLREGVLRVAHRPERTQAQGRFIPVQTREALTAMLSSVNDPTDIDGAYALVGLGRLAPSKVPLESVLTALNHAEERVVLAGLDVVVDLVNAPEGVAVARRVREAVVAAWAKAPLEEQRQPFASPERALFGRAARALLALAAIARVDRDSARALVADERLPIVERVWLVAELADPSFSAFLETWANDKDERTAALALYGGVLARRAAAGFLLRPQAEGLVGCASRAVIAETSARASAPAPPEKNP